jgi:FkbM family methyltransferase
MKSYLLKLVKMLFKKTGLNIYQTSNKNILFGKNANLDISHLRLGEKIDLIQLQDNNSPIFNWLLTKIHHTKSQYFQDLIVLYLLNGKENGYFIEFGACDGVELSNSLLLEEEYKWSGILCEPLYDYQSRLTENRSSKIDFRAVWPESGKNVYLENFGPLGLSKFREKNKFFKFNNPRNKAVTSVSLNDLLLFHVAPKEIDFISMDTEGNELEILKTFPFKNWKIKIFCIEHNFSENRASIRELMEKNNYSFTNFLCDPIDDWYILKN